LIIRNPKLGVFMFLRCVAVLTGGGDCPGLNAAIRAVVRPLLRRDIMVLGVEDGYQGLVEGRMRPLLDHDVSGIMDRGGTILGTTNRVDPFAYGRRDGSNANPGVDASPQIHENLKGHGIEALVVMGGDGTLAISRKLSCQGVNMVFVPKTIDNDLHGTDLTFGFHTAVQIATDAIDRIHTTGESHHRIMVVETMGRNAGWVALSAGLAAGGDVVLIPEIPFSIDGICASIKQRIEKGRRFSIVVVAEGACPRDGRPMARETIPGRPEPLRLGGIGQWVATELENCIGLEARAMVLGHLQRGGTPTAYDRILATRYGVMASDHCLDGAFGRMVRLRAGEIESLPMAEIPDGQRVIPHASPLVQAAKEVGIAFGEE
jgi:6-phosphofructokinase 1